MRYSGLTAEKQSVRLQVPEIRGIYKVVFVRLEDKMPLGEDEFFVQEPPAHR